MVKRRIFLPNFQSFLGMKVEWLSFGAFEMNFWWLNTNPNLVTLTESTKLCCWKLRNTHLSNFCLLIELSSLQFLCITKSFFSFTWNKHGLICRGRRLSSALNSSWENSSFFQAGPPSKYWEEWLLLSVIWVSWL